MKGTVFKYGTQGDPLVKPKSGGKIVVLTSYDERPEIGAEIEYKIDRQGKSVVYGTIQTSVERRQEQENPLERSLHEIQVLWNKSFAEYMTEESRVAFPQELEKIRDKYQKADYEGAAKLAHENYLWAVHKSDFCEILGPGFAYFDMFHAFDSLERLIRKSA